MANILFIYSKKANFTGALVDYTQAFSQFSHHFVTYLDSENQEIPFGLPFFDAIIINFCYFGRGINFDAISQKKLLNFHGKKIVILQDEQDYLFWHFDFITKFAPNLIITAQQPHNVPFVFGALAQNPNIQFMTALTGYVNDNLFFVSSTIPINKRAITIGYRSREVPYIFGKLTREKYDIGVFFQEYCQKNSITFDIGLSEARRIYGADWFKFMQNCRVVLGSESGSNIFDKNGEIHAQVADYLQKNPKASFDEVFGKFLQEHEAKIHVGCISPRVFEAIACKTGLLMFEGNYSGVVKPWVHFIPLKKDYSNISEVMAFVHDDVKLQKMIDTAYHDIILSGQYHYKNYIAQIDEWLDNNLPKNPVKIPIMAVIGWRDNENAPIKLFQSPKEFYPTHNILYHYDNNQPPFFKIYLNYLQFIAFIHRIYSLILYSDWGKNLHIKLRKLPIIYPTLKILLRILTLRKPF